MTEEESEGQASGKRSRRGPAANVSLWAICVVRCDCCDHIVVGIDVFTMVVLFLVPFFLPSRLASPYLTLAGVDRVVTFSL